MAIPHSIETAEILWFPKACELQEVHNLYITYETMKGCNKSERKEKRDFFHCKSILKLKRYLVDLLGINIDFKDVRLKEGSKFTPEKNNESKKKVVDQCIEHLYSITCDLRLEKKFSDRGKKKAIKNVSTDIILADDCCFDLIKKICSGFNGQSDVPSYWLDLNLNSILKDKSMVSVYYNIDLNDFSFGNLIGLNTFAERFNTKRFHEENPEFKITEIKSQFINNQSKFILYFLVGKAKIPNHKRTKDTHRLFKLEFSYDSFHRLLINDTEKSKFVVYLHYLTCPILYAVSKDDANENSKTYDDVSSEEDSEEDNKNYISFDDVTSETYWQRAIYLYDDCSADSDLKLQFAMNSVIRLEFKRNEYSCLQQLQNFNKNVDIFFSSMEIIPLTSKIQISSIDSKKYFECFYALKCLMTLNFGFVDQLKAREELKSFNGFVQEKSAENSEALKEALFDIYYAIERGSIVLAFDTIKMLYEKNVQKNKKQCSSPVKSTDSVLFDPNSLNYIKKAYLFPTHIRFCPPQISLTNRILKSAKSEYFMRVSVRDINFEKINFTVRRFGEGQKVYQKNFLDAYVKRPLLKGFKLGNYHYMYVGCSGSQLKSHSLWYFTVNPQHKETTVDSIRKNVGNFSNIPEVPKFMARFGLSFSQAMGRINIPQECTNVDEPDLDITGGEIDYLEDDGDEPSKKKYLKEINKDDDDYLTNDIKNQSEPEPYVFSDGIGRMSKVVAEEIWEALDLPDDEKPIAVQIRYAGCKGMLVVDPNLKKRQIKFRKSMKKYESNHSSLEVLKYSKPRNVFLNRHLIAILEQKGIKKEIFLKFQKEMIQTLVKGLFYDDNTWQVLNMYSQFRLDYEKLYKVGFSFVEDPFFRSMMLSVFRIQLQLLKERARIKLPDNAARNMFGVIDETKTLEYGQVFVQYTKWNSTKTKILEGIIVVTKNPCMHPGDVRKFEAIDVPDLRHIKDCIVFPANGDRPHPDEMAGSDLDGDEYVVIWHEDLIFNTYNSPALNYATKKVQKEKRERPIEVSDELNHFCNYLVNDVVGMLANAYLAWADKYGMISENGNVNETCLKIAKKYAKALDFAKTGIPATMDHTLTARNYPDFLNKKDGKNSYQSEKALGHLFRNCKNLELGLYATSDSMEYKHDNNLDYGEWKNYEEKAIITLNQYSKEIVSRLKRYDMQTEGELISGAIRDSKKVFLTTSEIYNAIDQLETEVQLLFSALEKEFFREFGGKPKNNLFSEEMLSKASAWYMVTYSKNRDSSQFFGLPWAISSVLLAIKLKCTTEIHALDNVMIKNSSRIERVIDKSVEKKLPNLNLENNESVHDYKNAILDTSYDVLSNWIKKLLFIICDENEAIKLLDEVFEHVSSKLIACDINYFKNQLSLQEKKISSPGYYILETLLQVADMGTNTDPNVTFSEAYQEFGLLTWITLVKLACSHNPSYLGLFEDFDRDSFHIMQEDIIDTIIIKLTKELIPIYNTVEESFRSFLIDRCKVKDISMNVISIVKKPKKKKKKSMNIEIQKKTEYKLKITARGSRFCIERLKSFVCSEKFLEEVKKNKQIQCDLDTAEVIYQSYVTWGKTGIIPPDYECESEKKILQKK